MEDMTLHQKQVLFSTLFAQLVLHVADYGYDAVIDAVARKDDPLCHGMRLAGDLLIFKGEDYITDGLDPVYVKLGAWWKNQHPLCRWGGDFTGKNKGDGNHFSITHGGKS